MNKPDTPMRPVLSLSDTPMRPVLSLSGSAYHKEPNKYLNYLGTQVFLHHQVINMFLPRRLLATKLKRIECVKEYKHILNGYG